MFAGTGVPVPPQDVAQISTNWPSGDIPTRMANYLCQAQQKWAVTAVTNAGGYLGSPYFKITVAGTERALAATVAGELTTTPSFNGEPSQLWRIELLADGTWRLMPKSVPGSAAPMALSAIGSSFATLSKTSASSEKQRWLIKEP
jgi:arabinan endo-1,5-alpha-L-arabinosidase